MNAKVRSAAAPGQGHAFNALLIVSLLLLWPATPALASHMESTVALKTACETSPGNTVFLNHPTKISAGAQTGTEREVVGTGCTIVLGSSGKFEVDERAMWFEGPLTITGGDYASVVFIESTVTANAITLTLTGRDSVLLVTESRLQTWPTGNPPVERGNLTIDMGPGGKVEIMKQLKPEFGGGGTLSAHGAINITGDTRFNMTLVEAHVGAQRGIRVTMAGPEAAFKADHAELRTNYGPVNITSPGAKGLVELNFGILSAWAGGPEGSGVTVALTGSESTLKVGNFALDGGRGGVTVEAGGSNNMGKLVVGLSRLWGDGQVTLRASAAAEGGSLTFEKSEIFFAGGDVMIETGTRGYTAVKESSLSSDTRIRIATGSRSVCTVENASIWAPVKEICW